MEYDDFLANVQTIADLPSADEATAAIEATLITLSERVPDDQARDLAEQLPDEVGTYLSAADDMESFDYDEFVARVMKREGETGPEDRPVAARHAQAVVAVLLDAVESRESDDLLSYLTEDYAPLFEQVDPEDVWGPGWRDRFGEAG
jgi:uncharacterized protein (DUF2267 family)